MKKMLLAVLLSVVLVWPVLLQAGDETSIRSVVEIDEMVVRATKTDEAKKDVSNNVIILDALKIQDSPANGLGDLLGGETGIDWRTYGDYGGASQTIQIRGMQGDGTQVIVNGITMNSPSVGTTDAGMVPTNNIERIEVVKGSGSVLYGSGAMSGLVNIITKSPEHDKIILGASAGYGTQETYKIEAEHGMFLTDQFGYFLTASQKSTDGFRDNADAKTQDASLKLVFEGSSMFNASLYGDIIKQESGNPGATPPSGTQPFSVNGTMLYNSESANLLNHSEDTNSHLVLEINGDPVNWLGISLQADYTDMESDSYGRYYDAFTAGNLPGDHTIVTNKVLGLEGNVKLKPIENGTLLMGVQYKNFDWDRSSENFDGFGNIATTINSNNGLHTTGYFSEVHFRPVKYFKAMVGIRYEDHSEFGSEVLPRFGFIINPTETTALKFNTGKHFKAPTPNDLFWPFQDYGFYSIQGNPNLGPETGNHSDIGIEQNFMNGKISASLTYFKWDIDDKIDWVFSSGAYAPQNLSKYEAEGYEAGLKIGPFLNTSLALSYTRTDAVEEAQAGIKRQSLYTPDDFFKASMTHWFDFGLDITAVFRYTSDRPANYATASDTIAAKTLDSYYTIDLKASQRIAKHWLISCQANNILDEDYGTYVQNFRDHSTAKTTLSEYKGAGRSFFVSLDYSF